MLPWYYWNVFQSPSSTQAISSPRPTLEALDVIQNNKFLLLIQNLYIKKNNI